MIEIEKLNEIKKALPRGGLKTIQKEAGVSYLTVLKFFNGKSQNVKVLEAAINVYKNHKSKVEQINSSPLAS